MTPSSAVAAPLRRMIVLLAAVAATLLTARLGWWQLDRAAQKTQLQASIDARAQLPELPGSALASTAQAALAQHYRAVRLQGQWLAQATVYLDNRQLDGVPGFIVVTPLLLAAHDAVLVQRGWVPRDPHERKALPALSTPGGNVEVRGRIAPLPARLYEFASDEAGPIRQNLDAGRLAQELGVALRPLSVQQEDDASAPAGPLLRRWSHPALDVSKNQGYAFQWFALSALIAGLYVWFQLLRPRIRRSAR